MGWAEASLGFSIPHPEAMLYWRASSVLPQRGWHSREAPFFLRDPGVSHHHQHFVPPAPCFLDSLPWFLSVWQGTGMPATSKSICSCQLMPVPYPPTSLREISLVSLSYSHCSRLINNPKPPSADYKLPQETDGGGWGVGWLEKLPDKACAAGRNLLMSF